MTAAELICAMWRECRLSAQQAKNVKAESVQRLIEQTRAILTEQGSSKQDADFVFFDLYTMAHWDWLEPTARIVEMLLEIELEEFFSERMMN